eukprot:5347486-Pyramimonas_sp.AAC.1
MQKRSADPLWVSRRVIFQTVQTTAAPAIRIWHFLYRHSVVRTIAIVCDAMLCYAIRRADL